MSTQHWTAAGAPSLIPRNYSIKRKMSTLPPLSFPSPLGLIFLLPLLTTTLLLHPRIPDAISRPLRLLLILPTVYLAARAPFDNRIGPEEASIGANFR